MKTKEKELQKNLSNALKQMIKLDKEYSDPNWNCGFRFLDNGAIICQFFYGNSWVYSNQPKFYFENKDKNWDEKICEQSIRCNQLKHFSNRETKGELLKIWIDFYFSCIQEDSASKF